LTSNGILQFDDGREEILLEYVSSHIKDAFPPDLPRLVIQFIDDFGVRKGKIVSDLITKQKPTIMIELGSYVGYSTVLFAAALRAAGGTEYISFEREPKFAKVASEMVNLAGLSGIVRFVVGSSSSGLVAECKAGRLDKVDMVFLDHYKPAYVKDLKILESLGAIQEDTVLAADNVIEPGNPTYLTYVRALPEEKQKTAKSSGKGVDVNGFPTKTVDQYKEYADDDVELPGVPAIVYESRIIRSHEPTGVPDGVEVTVCKSVPQNM
jgi:catechol O-methyltransferase